MSLLKQSILPDIATLSPALRAVIEEAYVVFAGDSVGIPLGVCKCNCCCSDESERLLVKTPVRQIPSALLSEYTNSAHGFSEASDGHALRYFLPRYLELIALNDPPHYGDLQNCLRRLGTAQYRRHWQPAETGLLDRFFDALLCDKLTDLSMALWPVGYRLAYPIDDLLEMIVLAGGDIDRVMRAWQSAPDPGASVHIASLARDLTSSGGEMILHSHFLTDHRDVCRAVGRFVCSTETVARLERVFFMLEARPELLAIVSDGHSLIASLVP